MSRENVKVVRRGVEAWNQRDADLWLSYATPEIEWMPAGPATVERTVYRGYEEVATGFATVWGTWEEFRLQESEVRDLGTPGRLSARLVELCERYGEAAPEGTIISLPLTQEELGAWTGASHAGVAKALQTLRELGWIQTHRKRIVVRNIDALRHRSS